MPTLLAALEEAIRPLSDSLADRTRQLLRKRTHDVLAAVHLFEQATETARQAGYGGLLVIVDEFGKLLEHAALHPETEDLLVMQDLAELAARSKVPLVLVTILHTAFAQYLQTADETRHADWQKVQGRFEDRAFLERPEQLLGLVKAALVTHFPDEVDGAYRVAVQQVLDSPAMEDARQRFPVHALLTRCVPLHPLSALLLYPIFRSKLAQHERSLFGFLTSPEPFGFQEFLGTTRWDGASPPFYRLDQLYDYVTTSLGAATYRGEHARQWVQVDEAVGRVAANAPRLARSVVKTIGLLRLYGPLVGLRPSKDTLATVFDDPQDVAEALAYLERTSIVVFRLHERAYGLWEGSDVDLNDRFEEAQQYLAHAGLATRLTQVIQPRPIVARAHYIATGTLRYFTVEIIDGSESAVREALAQPLAAEDGRILYVLSRTSHDRKALLSRARSLTSPDHTDSRRQILAFPRPMVGLEERLQEYEAWKWVRENTPALQGDWVARKELQARLLYAREQLEHIAGEALGLRGHSFNPKLAEWVHAGEVHTPPTAQDFLRWLSELCNQTYSEAPRLNNELLNRQDLSRAAVKARRNLLEAMLRHAEQQRLGFRGAPPEVSMYEAMLAAGGFHRLRNGRWEFGEPANNVYRWRRAWLEVERFLRETQVGRRAVRELYELLQKPPFGLRNGPLPILLAAVLLAHRHDVALYEDGTFIPELRIEVLERLTRVVDAFEVQQYPDSADHQQLFKALEDAIESLGMTVEETDSRILRLVKPLVAFAARLPAYAKQSRQFDPRAVAVRDTLLQARDPYELVIRDLPIALNASLDSRSSVQELGAQLRRVLQGLQRAYPNLLDQIEHQVRELFGVSGSYDHSREQLQARALPLVGTAVDRTLAVFVREASRVDGRDWREVLGRVAQGGVPPAQWTDRDAVAFQIRLRQIYSDFVRLEELVAEQRRTGAARVLRIGLLDGQVQEAREVIAISPESASVVAALAERISALLNEAVGQHQEDGRRIAIAALVQAVGPYLQRDPEVSE